MRLALATFGVLTLAACDFGASQEAAALRQELAARDSQLMNLEREVARLTVELANEREQRRRGEQATVVEERSPPLPPTDLTFPAEPAVDAAGIVCADNRCVVPRKTFEALVGDADRLSRQARVIPYLQDGQPRGFRVSAIRTGSILHTMGLQNGDRVTAIAGRELGGVDEALAAYAAIKAQREWTIVGVRKGAPFELKIVLAD